MFIRLWSRGFFPQQLLSAFGCLCVCICVCPCITIPPFVCYVSSFYSKEQWRERKGCNFSTPALCLCTQTVCVHAWVSALSDGRRFCSRVWRESVSISRKRQSERGKWGKIQCPGDRAGLGYEECWITWRERVSSKALCSWASGPELLNGESECRNRPVATLTHKHIEFWDNTSWPWKPCLI